MYNIVETMQTGCSGRTTSAVSGARCTALLSLSGTQRPGVEQRSQHIYSQRVLSKIYHPFNKRDHLTISAFSVSAYPLSATRHTKLQKFCSRAVDGDSSGEDVKYNKEFGYSRKDVILIGAGLIAAGYALYYGAQAAGVEATAAGNYVQLLIFLVICVGYISTYIYRVANKDMTYAKQLENYEERVMQKRLEEMPETERERLIAEVEQEKSRKNPES